MNKQVKLAMIGAGNRGQGIFGNYAEDMPHRAKFTVGVEPNQAKRFFFAAEESRMTDKIINLREFEDSIRIRK
jgi:hypothetical protein